MRRKATKAIFVDGALRQEGEVFEASRKWRYTVEEDEGLPKESAGPRGFNRKAVMAELTAAGVEFKGNASNEALANLLVEAKQRQAPAASAAPSKEHTGVGDQDVI